jgi:hypothetical protein
MNSDRLLSALQKNLPAGHAAFARPFAALCELYSHLTPWLMSIECQALPARHRMLVRAARVFRADLRDEAVDGILTQLADFPELFRAVLRSLRAVRADAAPIPMPQVAAELPLSRAA